MRLTVLAAVMALAVPALTAPNPNPEPEPQPTYEDPHTLFPRYSCSVFSDYCPQDCLAGRSGRDCSASYVSSYHICLPLVQRGTTLYVYYASRSMVDGWMSIL